jgi:hypothetical protein
MVKEPSWYREKGDGDGNGKGGGKNYIVSFNPCPSVLAKKCKAVLLGFDM